MKMLERIVERIGENGELVRAKKRVSWCAKKGWEQNITAISWHGMYGSILPRYKRAPNLM